MPSAICHCLITVSQKINLKLLINSSLHLLSLSLSFVHCFVLLQCKKKGKQIDIILCVVVAFELL